MTSSDNLQIAARVSQVACEMYQLVYARISPDLKIVQCSPKFESILDFGVSADLLGSPLVDFLFEFVGMEEVLRDILNGHLPSFQIERIHRTLKDGSVRYLTFHVVPYAPDQPQDGLLLLVDDVTPFGETEQILLQKRNELHIAQIELKEINEELDKRVEQRTAELESAKMRIEKQLHYMQALVENGRVILGATDLKLALRSIVRDARAQLNVDSAAVLLFDQHARMLEPCVTFGSHLPIFENSIHLGEGCLGVAVLERRTLAFPNFNESKPDDLDHVSYGDIQALYILPLISKGQVLGVLAVASRQPLSPDRDWLDFLDALAAQAAVTVDSIRSFENLQKSNMELSLAYSTTIEGWSHALDLRDRETKGHTQRVTDMTIRLARMAGRSEMELTHIKHGALLHDIGKMGIPDNILLKDGRLTEEEWEVMRRHPTYAYEMLSPIEYLRPALDIPYCHHEKWNGSGYPRGLQGEQIPLAARLFSVVDVWDALRSDRPYRQGWDDVKVLEYIQKHSGTYFDPKAVELFVRLIRDTPYDLQGE